MYTIHYQYYCAHRNFKIYSAVTCSTKEQALYRIDIVQQGMRWEKKVIDVNNDDTLSMRFEDGECSFTCIGYPVDNTRPLQADGIEFTDNPILNALMEGPGFTV